TEGSLLCAWFGGTAEGGNDVGIWMSERRAPGWSAPVQRAKVVELAHWNPVLFRDGADRIHLFFKVGANTRDWQTWWMHRNGPGDWTMPVELVPGDAGGRGPVKNKPILLHDGAWLAPASTEHRSSEPGRSRRPFADRSDDNGATWTRSEDFPMADSLPGDGAIQPTFWESAPGEVHALMRTGSGRLWRSDSADGGRTWTPVYATSIPNNNSGVDLVRLHDGRLLLVSNPVGIPFGFRNVLLLSVSTDDGLHWQPVARLEYSWNPFQEYSYPSIVPTGDGVAVSYTWKRERVRTWQIPASVLDEVS
ncbi:MAG: exo-alpha-sialidase, partial [Candidatus Hydrogenedentes bacterium]|nr:exo-alpha-sialidase [Candidatus Hydrogenedentota bacterium]